MLPYPLIGGAKSFRIALAQVLLHQLQSSPLSLSHNRGEIQIKMEKITDKIAALPPDENYFSLEFFPPKTQMVGYPRTL
jgi:methylenetetrahydrofolate reductase (NADPH)